jgi:hypothetical protein
LSKAVSNSSPQTTVDKRNIFFNVLVAAAVAQGARDIAPPIGARKATECLQLRIGCRNLRNPQGLPTSCPAISGNCLAFATMDVDLSL